MVRRGNPSKMIGKTIKDVIVVNRAGLNPHSQVFLLFDDDTHYEFYGDNILVSGAIYEGGKSEVLNYIRDSGAYVNPLVA
jgi:hypothetical protein